MARFTVPDHNRELYDHSTSSGQHYCSLLSGSKHKQQRENDVEVELDGEIKEAEILLKYWESVWIFSSRSI